MLSNFRLTGRSRLYNFRDSLSLAFEEAQSPISERPVSGGVLKHTLRKWLLSPYATPTPLVRRSAEQLRIWLVPLDHGIGDNGESKSLPCLKSFDSNGGAEGIEPLASALRTAKL